MAGSGTSRTATLLVLLAVATGLAILASVAGSIRATSVSALAGALLGVAVLSRTRESPLGAGAASLLVPLVAPLVVAGIGLSILAADVAALVSGEMALPEVLRSAVAAVGASLAAGLGAFGVVGTLRHGIGEGAVSRFFRSTLATTTVVVLGLAVVLLPRFDALRALPVPRIDLSVLLDPVLSPVDPWIGLITFWLLLAALAQVVRIALDRLPLVELASRTYRERIANTLERLDSLLGTLVFVTFVLAFATLGAVATGTASRLLVSMPALRNVLAFLATPALRLAIVALIGVLGVVALVSGLLKRLAGSATDVLRAFLPSTVGGILACVLAIPVASLVGVLLERLPVGAREPAREVVGILSPLGAVLATLAGVMLVLSGLLAVVSIAGAFQYVPSRAAGSAFAASGLVVGALAVGVARDAPLVVFVLVGLAILAWDAGERGVVTRAELGARPPVHVDVVHAVGSLAVATLGMALAWVLYANALESVAVPGGNVPGAVATIVASLVLIGVLRG